MVETVRWGKKAEAKKFPVHEGLCLASAAGCRRHSAVPPVVVKGPARVQRQLIISWCAVWSHRHCHHMDKYSTQHLRRGR